MEILLLIPNNIKNSVIKKVRKNNPNLNIKFSSLEEFIQKYTFSYDDKAIYFLMKEYNLKYDTVKVYLDNLYYISDRLNNKKMDKLREIKSFLDKNNLLIYNKIYQDYVKDKEIYIYGYKYLTKYQLSVLEGLNYKIIPKQKNKYSIENIYYAENIEEEVVFVANKISKLLKKKVNIENIKLMNVTSEYENILERIFKFYNIKINIKKVSIYSTLIVKDLLDNLDDLDKFKESLNFRNKEVLDIYNKIVKVMNKYSFISNKDEVRDLIIKDLKNTYMDDRTIKKVEILDINSLVNDEDYVFFMGFNKENVPFLYKDDGYFSDREKEILGFDTSVKLNILEKEAVIKNITSIKNLTITYKLFDNANNYTPSNLFENVNIVKINNDIYTHSNLANKVFLTQMLDNLVKYNIKDNSLELLYSNYKDIEYLTYDNNYHNINVNLLNKYLDNKLLLSYTALDNYNRCKFRFYLSNVLKINIIKNDFAILIGNVCHYLLSNMDRDDFDIDLYYDNYLKDVRKLSNREKFFLNNIKEEMYFVVDTIKKQLSYTTFDKKMYEEKVYVNKDRSIKVTFMGVIDKVLYKEEGNVTYLAVIDYKTGSANIKVANINYGLDMQLPIYLYLSSNMKLKNVKIVGFYLQKILNNSLDNSKSFLEAKENNLKLEGYSIKNEQILSKFDTTYEDSKLIKSMKLSSNGFYSYAKVLEEEEINNLIKHVNEVIDKAIDNILKADFTIDPKVIDNKNVSCNFCDYKDICYHREENIVFINRKEDSDE